MTGRCEVIGQSPSTGPISSKRRISNHANSRFSRQPLSSDIALSIARMTSSLSGICFISDSPDLLPTDCDNNFLYIKIRSQDLCSHSSHNIRSSLMGRKRSFSPVICSQTMKESKYRSNRTSIFSYFCRSI